MEDSFSRSTSLVEEQEVFEITDFTTASDWERFVAGISEIITDWKLTRIENLKPLEPNELTRGQWEILSRNLAFSNVSFTLTLHRLKQATDDLEEEEDFKDSEEENEEDLRTPCYLNDLISPVNEFPPRAHCLVRWYGMRCFCILSLSQPTNHAITSESKCNLLLSSICTVLSECGCETPIFVQIQQSWRRMFFGRCVGSGMQTNFEMVHLRKCPPIYHRLSGLLHLFKNKIGAELPIKTCLVSANFTYVLNDWGQSGAWPSEKLDAEKAASRFDEFLFGLAEECISELHLHATWPSISEEMVVDNDVHSDFEPLRAPKWSIRLRYVDDVRGFLTSYVSELVKVINCEKSVTELISVTENQDNEQDIGMALQRITNPSAASLPNNARGIASGITKIVEAPRSSIQKRLRKSFVRSKGPLSQETLETIMDYLLPENAEKSDKTSSVLNREYQQVKSAPLDSLTYKLSVCFVVVNFCHGGVEGMAQLWHEFVQEMRYRLENSVLLPDVGEENPDLRTCLLHQKLQMLNCCILHKIRRDNSIITRKIPEAKPPNLHVVESTTSFLSTASSVHEEAQKETSVTSEDEDEFFECETEDEATQEETEKHEEESETVEDAGDRESEAADEQMNVSQEIEEKREPEGRHELFGDNINLLNSDELLYIPVTQEPAPLTEDALEEQTKIFSSLGDSPEGATLRMKMQSASLFSDMQSFKAANPGCILEDFVRWYSPRDFTQEVIDGKTVEELSERMKLPGNVWIVMWDSAKPIPVRRQKRLFDDTKEGEKVMLFLSSMNLSQLSKHILPICFHHALSVLREKCLENSLTGVSKICDQLFVQISKAFHHIPNVKVEKLDDMIRQFQFIETLIERTRSLNHKFKSVDDCQEFVKSLLENPEIQLKDAASGHIGKLLLKYFKTQQDNLQKHVVADVPEDSAHTQHHHHHHKKHVSPLPQPAGKEFVIRTEAPRPSLQSRTLPHKMYAVLAPGSEFRLAGAFSSDTVFF